MAHMISIDQFTTVCEAGTIMATILVLSLGGNDVNVQRLSALHSQPPVNPARRSPAITAGQPRMMSQMRPDR